MPRHLARFLSCLLGWTLLGCAGATDTGNPTAGGTDTGNPTLAKVFGRAMDSLGNPVPGVKVRLLPAAYNPVVPTISPDSLSDSSDVQGFFLINVYYTGTYTLTGAAWPSGLRILHPGIAVADSAVIDLGEKTLARPGAILAEISGAHYVPNGSFYLPGTEIFAPVPGPGQVFIDSVPAGIVHLRYYLSSTGQVIPLGVSFNNINVPSVDTVRVADAGSTAGISFSGDGKSIQYANFEFGFLNFMGLPWTFILSGSGPDSLLINTFQLLPANTPIALTDTAAIQIAASMAGVQYTLTNVDEFSTGFVTGSLTFSVFDTAQTMAGTFSSGASLLGVRHSDSTKFKVTVSGGFSARRAF